MIKRRKKTVGRKRAYVRTDVVWFKYMAIAILFFLSGAGTAYYYLDAGKALGFFMYGVGLEKDITALKQQIIEHEISNEIKKNTFTDMEKQLEKSLEEREELKENLIFYEKIIGKKGK